MEKIKFNSQIRPPTNPHDFDAHIYFSLEDIDLIKNLKVLIEANFSKEKVFVGNIIPYPIGPHTLPMLEINFAKEDFQDMVFFLMKYRSHLKILVHEISDDDYRDHTAGAMWLGGEVKLLLEKFQ